MLLQALRQYVDIKRIQLRRQVRHCRHDFHFDHFVPYTPRIFPLSAEMT